MEFKNRYYYDDNGKVIQKEFNNLINKDFKNFIEDPIDYPIKDIKIVDKKIVLKTDSDKEKDEQEVYSSLTWDRKRVTKYPHIENQVDAIYKGFQAIKNTIALPQETLDWLDQCKKVKEDIPKE